VSAFVAVDELYQALDPQTLDILERRRGTTVVRRRGWFVRRALLAADLVGLSAAFLTSQEIYAMRVHAPGGLSQLLEFVTFALALPLWVVAAKVYGLYDKDEERTDHSTPDDFARLFHLVTVCTFLLYAASRMTRWFNPEFSKIFVFWFLAIIATGVLRALARTVCRRNIHYLQNTIILGAGDVGQSIARKLLSHTEYGINLVGFVDGTPKERVTGLKHLTILGDLSDLEHLIPLLDVERAIVAFSNEGHDDILRAIQTLRAFDVQIDIVPRFFDGLGPSVALHAIEGIPLVCLPPRTLAASSIFLKRALDVGVSAIALLAFAPLLVLIALLVKLDSKGPATYRHLRIGRYGEPFELFKFRTMHAEFCRGDRYGGRSAEEAFDQLIMDPVRRLEFESTYKFADDPRVTRVGRFLRKASLDEFPQLLNVLRGDISLVGPRPLTSAELEEYYGPAAAELLRLRPGVTGYWQINGRSNLEYEDRVRLDMAYVGGWTLGLDLMILARTIRVIATRHGAT
jgi:exopolysaccharide biosynthesis polyprenyl glycosylphosphotransferase